MTDHRPEQLFEVINGHGLGDQPQPRWRTVERLVVDELKFDQHPMDPCAFLLMGAGDERECPPGVAGPGVGDALRRGT